MSGKYFSIYVGNLNSRTEQEDLEYMFGKYGEIGAIYLKSSDKSGRVNYGFVRYFELSSAKKAMELNGCRLLGNRIYVQFENYTRHKIHLGYDKDAKYFNHGRSRYYTGRRCNDYSDGNQTPRDRSLPPKKRRMQEPFTQDDLRISISDKRTDRVIYKDNEFRGYELYNTFRSQHTSTPGFEICDKQQMMQNLENDFGSFCSHPTSIAYSAVPQTEQTNIPTTTLPKEHYSNIPAINTNGPPPAVKCNNQMVHRLGTPVIPGNLPAVNFQSDPVLPHNVSSLSPSKVQNSVVSRRFKQETVTICDCRLHSSPTCYKQGHTNSTSPPLEDEDLRQSSVIAKNYSNKLLAAHSSTFSENDLWDEDWRMKQKVPDASIGDNHLVTLTSKNISHNPFILSDRFGKEESLENSPYLDMDKNKSDDLNKIITWCPYTVEKVSEKNTAFLQEDSQLVKSSCPFIAKAPLHLSQTNKSEQYLDNKDTSINDMDVGQIPFPLLEDKEKQSLKTKQTVAELSYGNQIIWKEGVENNRKIFPKEKSHHVYMKGITHNSASADCSGGVGNSESDICLSGTHAIENGSDIKSGIQCRKSGMSEIQMAYQDVDFGSLIVPPPPPLPDSEPPAPPPLPETPPPPAANELLASHKPNSVKQRASAKVRRASVSNEEELTVYHYNMFLNPRTVTASKKEESELADNHQREKPVSRNKERSEGVSSAITTKCNSWKTNFIEFWKDKLRSCDDKSKSDHKREVCSTSQRKFTKKTDGNSSTNRVEESTCPTSTDKTKMSRWKPQAGKELNPDFIKSMNAKLKRTKDFFEKQLNASKMDSVINIDTLPDSSVAKHKTYRDSKESGKNKVIDLTEDKSIDISVIPARKDIVNGIDSKKVCAVLSGRISKAKCLKNCVFHSHKQIFKHRTVKEKKKTARTDLKCFPVGVDHKTLLKPYGEYNHCNEKVKLLQVKCKNLDTYMHTKQSKDAAKKDLAGEPLNTFQKPDSVKESISSGLRRDCPGNMKIKMPGFNHSLRKMYCQTIKNENEVLGNQTDKSEPLVMGNQMIKSIPGVPLVTEKSNFDFCKSSVTVKKFPVENSKKSNSMVASFKKDGSVTGSAQIASHQESKSNYRPLSHMSTSEKESVMTNGQGENEDGDAVQAVVKAKNWLSYRAEALKKINDSNKPYAVAKKPKVLLDWSTSEVDNTGSISSVRVPHAHPDLDVKPVSDDEELKNSFSAELLESEPLANLKESKLSPIVSKTCKEKVSPSVQTNPYTSYLDAPGTPAIPVDSPYATTSEWKSWSTGPDIFDLEYLKSLGNFRTDFGIVAGKCQTEDAKSVKLKTHSSPNLVDESKGVFQADYNQRRILDLEKTSELVIDEPTMDDLTECASCLTDKCGILVRTSDVENLMRSDKNQTLTENMILNSGSCFEGMVDSVEVKDFTQGDTYVLALNDMNKQSTELESYATIEAKHEKDNFVTMPPFTAYPLLAEKNLSFQPATKTKVSDNEEHADTRLFDPCFKRILRLPIDPLYKAEFIDPVIESPSLNPFSSLYSNCEADDLNSDTERSVREISFSDHNDNIETSEIPTRNTKVSKESFEDRLRLLGEKTKLSTFASKATDAMAHANLGVKSNLMKMTRKSSRDALQLNTELYDDLMKHAIEAHTEIVCHAARTKTAPVIDETELDTATVSDELKLNAGKHFHMKQQKEELNSMEIKTIAKPEYAGKMYNTPASPNDGMKFDTDINNDTRKLPIEDHKIKLNVKKDVWTHKIHGTEPLDELMMLNTKHFTEAVEQNTKLTYKPLWCDTELSIHEDKQNTDISNDTMAKVAEEVTDTSNLETGTAENKLTIKHTIQLDTEPFHNNIMSNEGFSCDVMKTSTEITRDSSIQTVVQDCGETKQIVADDETDISGDASIANEKIGKVEEMKSENSNLQPSLQRTSNSPPLPILLPENYNFNISKCEESLMQKISNSPPLPILLPETNRNKSKQNDPPLKKNEKSRVSRTDKGIFLSAAKFLTKNFDETRKRNFGKHVCYANKIKLKRYAASSKRLESDEKKSGN